jgi:hypothetical protein
VYGLKGVDINLRSKSFQHDDCKINRSAASRKFSRKSFRTGLSVGIKDCKSSGLMKHKRTGPVRDATVSPIDDVHMNGFGCVSKASPLQGVKIRETLNSAIAIQA